MQHANQKRSVTEMLDVAPFEFFAWVDKESLQKFKFPAAMVEEGMDIELHWVTEDGSPAPMRSGAEIKPTVSDGPTFTSTTKENNKLTAPVLRTHSPHARRSTSCSWARTT